MGSKKAITSITGEVYTGSAVAELFGVTDRTIRNWRAEGMPEAADGKYRLHECFAWWLENINKPSSDKEEKARERYWQAKASREEHAVKILIGESIARDQVEKEWCARLIEVVRGLESQISVFPSLLCDKTAEEIRDLVESYNRKLRENYARDGKFTPVIKKAQPKKPAKKKKAGKKK